MFGAALTAGLASGLGSAVSGLLGGLFGKKKSSAQGVDYAKLRRDAEAAGFNPLTALLAGGGAGYQREFNPELSSDAFIAEAVTRGLDTVFNRAFSGTDPAVQQVQHREQQKQASGLQKLVGTPGAFGYHLTDQRPFGSAVTHSGPKLTAKVGGDERSGVSDSGHPVGRVPLSDPYVDRGFSP